MATLPPDLEKILKGSGPDKINRTFSLTREVADEFREYCAANNLSASHIVESLVRWYLKQVTDGAGRK